MATAQVLSNKRPTKKGRNFEGMAAVEECRKGAFLHMIRAGKPTKKEYEFVGYCRYNKAYEVGDLDDISQSRYIKKGQKILITCNY